MDKDEFEEDNIYKCILSLVNVGLLCSKDSPEEKPTMKYVIMLVSIKEQLVANAVASRRLTHSTSDLLSNTNTTRNDALHQTTKVLLHLNF
jgi:hypothetical protein